MIRTCLERASESGCDHGVPRASESGCDHGGPRARGCESELPRHYGYLHLSRGVRGCSQGLPSFWMRQKIWRREPPACRQSYEAQAVRP